MPSFNYSINEKKSFINPYNFVRPDGETKRGNGYGKGETVTGKLHCKLYIKTPLAVLDTESVEEEEIPIREDDKEKIIIHDKYRFNRSGEKLMIPGSSIRGCVRSMYETLTNSCFATLPKNTFLTNRVASTDAYKPAILIKEKNDWAIYDAKRLSVDTKERSFEILYEDGKRKLKYNGTPFSFGDCVKVTESNNKVRSLVREGNNDYVLFIGEPFGSRKHNESVFKKGNKIPVDKEVLNKAKNGLEFSIEMYGKETINKQLGSSKHTGYASYNDAKEKGVIPVWCKKTLDGKNVVDISLSIAAIGRKVYKNTVNDLIGPGLVACQAIKENREKSLCPACQLFGTAKGSGYGSRVRFTDAECVDEKPEAPVTVTLKELGLPRTGYLPFYALDGIDYDSNGANINGRKFYWHNPSASDDSNVYSTEEKTDRNSTVEIMKKGVFEFDVFFDGISQEQLETLKWALSLGENSEDSKYCYKMGYGKPIGLGSVKICISEQTCREVGIGYDYSIHTLNNPSVLDNTKLLNDSTKKQIQIISDYELLRGMDVRYPYIDIDDAPNCVKQNDVAPHKWFSEAKGVRKDEDMVLLPNISDAKENPLHPYAIAKVEDKHGSRRDDRNSSHKPVQGNNTHSKYNKNVNRRTYKVNDIFEGEIIRFDASRQFAYVKNANGEIVSFFCDRKAEMGESVILKKTGENKKGYDVWQKQNN